MVFRKKEMSLSAFSIARTKLLSQWESIVALTWDKGICLYSCGISSVQLIFSYMPNVSLMWKLKADQFGVSSGFLTIKNMQRAKPKKSFYQLHILSDFHNGCCIQSKKAFKTMNIQLHYLDWTKNQYKLNRTETFGSRIWSLLPFIYMIWPISFTFSSAIPQLLFFHFRMFWYN